MKGLESIQSYFLLLLVVVSLYFGYQIFQPYLAVIIMAGIFSLLFSPIYKWLVKKLKGREGLAAFFTVFAFILVILIPLTNFIAVLVTESIDSYPAFESIIVDGIESSNSRLADVQNLAEQYLPFLDLGEFSLTSIFLDLSDNLTRFILKNANIWIAGTTNFVISIFFMLITMFFLLKDGSKFKEKVMHLTPLPNRYDKLLFEKFKEVSKSTILSSVATALIQGTLAAIAFAIVGLPAFFLGVVTAVASLIPFFGTALVWVPVALSLALTGSWGAALFIAIWGGGIVSLSDNLIRTKLIGSQSKIHPLLIFFSIFGGLKLWGFLGIIFGPLTLAIILTVLHIYAIEYDDILEK